MIYFQAKRESTESDMTLKSDQGRKRKSEEVTKCGCNGDCTRKLCTCRKLGVSCVVGRCKCSPDKCMNKKDDEEDKENDSYIEEETTTIRSGVRSPQGLLDVSTIGLGAKGKGVSPDFFKK